MGYKLNDKKVLLAIDHIVKDVDKKFDECLVEKFLEFIQKELSLSDHWIVDSKAIVDRVNSFINHKAFVMLNQARAFKTVYSIINSRDLDQEEFQHVSPLLDSVWNSLGMIIANDNLAAMTAILCILDRLVLSKPGYSWIVNNKIEPSLRFSSSIEYTITDTASLARYFIETSKNYHTKHKAEKFFTSLVMQSIFNAISDNHSQALSIRRTIRELMLKGSESILCILLDILSSMSPEPLDSKRELLFERYELQEIIQETFITLIEKPGITINNFCKCLAFANREKFRDELVNERKIQNLTIEKLKSKRHLEGTIVYLAYSSSEYSEFNQKCLAYLLYPLMTVCESEDTQLLVRRLIATRDELDFIDKNMNDRIVALCLAQIVNIFTFKFQSNHLTSRTLVLDTLINYVKCQITVSRNYKNVMECCSVIERLFKRSNLAPIMLSSIISIHDILGTVQYNSKHMKPILLKLLEILRFNHRSFSNLTLLRDIKSAEAYLLKTVELAFRFEDLDILNEFAMFFKMNQIPDTLEKQQIEHYVEMLRDHIYMNAKDSDHFELLDNIKHLLHEVDVDVTNQKIDKHNIHTSEATQDRDEEVEDHPPRASDRVALYSLVDDILNYELISDGISDCY